MNAIVNSFERTLADRLKRERTARGWSMADLAERSGVSKAMIAKIESCAASPTAALLVKLSGAFELSLSTLLAGAEGGGRLQRRDEQPTWRDPGTGYVRRAVSAPGARGAEIVEVELPAGARVDTPASSHAFLIHQILALSGTLRFHEGDVVYELQPGDWLEFGALTDCAYENAGAAPCRYLVILTRP